jgi:hypothetical protein
MAEIPKYERWEIQNYISFVKTTVPKSGELIYFLFTGSLSWIKNIVHVIGDATSQVDQLPFIETMIMETDINKSLEEFRIAGNKALIQNTHASNTILINIGVVFPGDISYEIKPGDMVLLKFDGSNWIEQKKTGAFTLKLSSDYTIPDGEEIEHYLTENNITVTLPLLINNQNKEHFCIINTDDNLKTIIRQGPDTINGFEKIYLYEKGDFVRIIPTVSEWVITDQSVNYDSGRINTNDWTTRGLGTVVVGYDNLTLGSIKIGDIVTGVTSGATGKVIYFTGADIYLYQVTLGGIFTNNEIINFTDGASALVNEPAGTNKNKDTDLYVWGMGDKIQYIDKKFIIHQANNNIAVIEPNHLSYYNQPPSGVWYGSTYFYAGNDRLAFKTADYGIDYISFVGSRIVVDVQDWWYRHQLRIRY